MVWSLQWISIPYCQRGSEWIIYGRDGKLALVHRPSSVFPVSHWFLNLWRKRTQCKGDTGLIAVLDVCWFSFISNVTSSHLTHSPWPVMSSGTPLPERIIFTNCYGHSEDLTRMEVIWAHSELDDSHGAFVDQVVSEEHPTGEEHPMWAERTVPVSQLTFTDALQASLAWSKTPWPVRISPMATTES